MELRLWAAAPQVTGLHVLHQVSGLLRAGFRDTASDEVRNDVPGLHDSKDELRDLADRRNRIQVGRAEGADSAVPWVSSSSLADADGREMKRRTRG